MIEGVGSIWVVLVVLTVYYVVGWVQQSMIAKKFGCKRVKVYYNDWTLGFHLAYTFFKARRDGRLIELVTLRYKKYQSNTLSFPLAGRRVIVTREPENIKAILGTQFEDFVLGQRHAYFKPLLGDGIFTLDGEGWKHSRTMLRPQFAREQIAHVQTLEPHIQTLARVIRQSSGKRFEIQTLFFKFTIDSATEFLFGESVESLKDELWVDEKQKIIDFEGKQGFADAFNTAQLYLADRLTLQKLYFLVDNKEFRASVEHTHKFTDHYVHKALQMSPEEIDNASRNGYTFLYELVKKTRNPETLRYQALNILLAGRDTTAGLLSFAFFELGRNPHIWEKLKNEIYSKFGSAEDSNLEEITFESLKKCEYLKAVLNETLRMYPSVPQNFRIATKNTTLPKGGGPDGLSPIFVPKNITVMYSVAAMQRQPEYYGDDADTFRPERWQEPSTKKLGWAYLPFNGGPRICLGQQFALTEAAYTITRLVQLFPKITSFCEEYPPKKSSHLTMCHHDGVFIGLE